MTFAFSLEDVKNFINSIDKRASEVDAEISAISSLVADFNASIVAKCEPVRGVIAEEERKLPVLRMEFEEAEKRLKQAKEKLATCPLVIWIPKNDIYGKPDGQMPIPNPAYADYEAEVEECEAKLNKAEWALQHSEEKIDCGNSILQECSNLEIKIRYEDFDSIKKEMGYKLMDVQRKTNKVISYGEDVLSFSFNYNPNSKKYYLRIK